MEEFCRICTRNDVSLINIFDQRDQQEQEPPLIDMLNEFVNREIKLNDPLPQNICLACNTAARSAFHFKRLCEQSQEYFWQLLSAETVPNCEEENSLVHYTIEFIEDSVGYEQQSSNTQFENEVIIAMDQERGEEVILKEEIEELSNENNYEQRSFECLLCEQNFLSQEYLLQHSRICTRKTYLCTYCSKTYTSQWNLNYHLRIHTGERPHKCSLCNADFRRRDDLSWHMVSHTGEIPFVCPHCSKRFINKSSLNRHVRIHMENIMWKCGFCGDIFESDHYLRKHKTKNPICKSGAVRNVVNTIVSINGLTPNEMTQSGKSIYKCQICSMSFTTSGDLDLHSEAHDKETGFKCSSCPLIFLTKAALKNHMQIHSDETEQEDIDVIPGAETIGNSYPVLLTEIVPIKSSENLTNENPAEAANSNCTVNTVNLEKNTEYPSEDQPDFPKNDNMKATNYDNYTKNQILLTELVPIESSEDLTNGDLVKADSNCKDTSNTNIKGLAKESNSNSNVKKNKNKKRASNDIIKPWAHNSWKSKLSRKRRKRVPAKAFFPCDKCDQQFDSMPQLFKHKRVHPKEPTPFKCQYCSKAYKKKAHLLQHSPVHKCKHCLKSFKRTKLLCHGCPP